MEENRDNLPKAQDMKRVRLKNMRKEFVQFAAYATILVFYLMVIYPKIALMLEHKFMLTDQRTMVYGILFFAYVPPIVLLVAAMIILKMKKKRIIQHILHTMWITFYFEKIDLNLVNTLVRKVWSAGMGRGLRLIVVWGTRILVVLLPFVLFVVIPYVLIEKKQKEHK